MKVILQNLSNVKTALGFECPDYSAHCIDYLIHLFQCSKVCGAMLDLGCPDAFQYVICSTYRLEEFFESVERGQFDPERLPSKRREKLIKKRARAKLDSFPRETFLRYRLPVFLRVAEADSRTGKVISSIPELNVA